MLSDVAQELNVIETFEPVYIIDKERIIRGVAEAQEAREGLAQRRDIFCDCVFGEDRALCIFAGGVADERRAAADDDDRSMTGLLPAAQAHDREQIADMETRRGAVEADIGRLRRVVQQCVELGGIRTLMDQVALIHFVQEVIVVGGHSSFSGGAGFPLSTCLSDDIRHFMDRCVHIAPMMGLTDHAGRFLMRCLSRHLQLWTEMISAPALVNGDAARILGTDEGASSVILQLGGGRPEELAAAARIGEAAGYREINLNAGCPSCRVSAGGFGAALMLEPSRAARCVEAIAEAVDIPVSVKCRIGVDDQEPEEVLPEFVRLLSRAGARYFVIHARKAWLKGLNPKQNRNVPPLNYELVYCLKSEFPESRFILNGGIGALADVARHIDRIDGVMIGRAAFRDPFMLTDLDRRFFGVDEPRRSRYEVLSQLVDYAERKDLPRAKMIRLASGLWAGERGVSDLRRALNAHIERSSVLVAARALAA